jgi:hypothetical protein
VIVVVLLPVLLVERRDWETDAVGEAQGENLVESYAPAGFEDCFVGEEGYSVSGELGQDLGAVCWLLLG